MAVPEMAAGRLLPVAVALYGVCWVAGISAVALEDVGAGPLAPPDDPTPESALQKPLLRNVRAQVITC